MKKLEKISVLSLLLVLVMTLTACGNGELGLYNAMIKQQDIKSMDMSTNVGFNMSVEGIAEQDKEVAQEVIDMMNSYKISMEQRVISNDDRTKIESFAKSNIDMGGLKIEVPIWQDIDMSTDDLKFEQLIKMPEILMNNMGEEFKGKTYIDYDMIELMKEQNQEKTFKEIIKWSKEIQGKYDEFLKNGLKEMDPKLNMVSSLGTKSIAGEKLNIYELKLNDENFKKFMKFIGNTGFENKELVKFFDEYMELVMNISDITELEKEEINSDWTKVKGEKFKFQDKFNEFMTNIEDIKILSDDGIVVEYGVNKDGYIVYQKGNINILVDLDSIGKKIVKENIPMRDDFKGKINLKINFENNIKNINNKDLKIEKPNNTDKNTIKISELTKSLETNIVEIENN